MRCTVGAQKGPTCRGTEGLRVPTLAFTFGMTMHKAVGRIRVGDLPKPS